MGRRIYNECPAVPLTAVGTKTFDIENADFWCMEVTSVKGGATNFIYQTEVSWNGKTWTKLTEQGGAAYNTVTAIGTDGVVTETNDETNYYHFNRSDFTFWAGMNEGRDLTLASKIRLNLATITDDAGASVLTVTVHTWTFN